MGETILVRAFAATAPVLKNTPNGVPVTTFRIASTPRWYDQSAGVYREGTTNWYTVNAFRALAQNTARSIRVGQPVLVSGRLKVKKWDREDGTTMTNVEIDAQSIGHDLSFGTAHYERTVERCQEPQAQPTPATYPQHQQQHPVDLTPETGATVSGQQPENQENFSCAVAESHTAPDSLAAFDDLVEDPEEAKDAIVAMTH